MKNKKIQIKAILWQKKASAWLKNHPVYIAIVVTITYLVQQIPIL